MSLLQEILSSEQVHDPDGNVHRLHSHTGAAQCAFLRSLIERNDARRCLEVGLAYGISALAICGAISGRDDRVYYSIDPMQEFWKNIGTENLKRAGYWEFVKFFPNYSDEVLPFLWKDGVEIDFAYIDSTKVFDQLCVDVHFCTKILRVGGVLVLDDVGYPGIRKLARLMTQQPHWKMIDSYEPGRMSPKRSMLARAVSVVPFRDELIAPEFQDIQRENRLHAQAIAF